MQFGYARLMNSSVHSNLAHNEFLKILKYK